MTINEKEREVIKKYCEIIDCNWFEFTLDDYGNYCVYDHEEKKKLPLHDGLRLLSWHNSELEDFFLNHESFQFKLQDEEICLINILSEQKVKHSQAIRLFLQKYNDIETINSLLSNAEKDLCRTVFRRARCHHRLTRERLFELMQKTISVVEKTQNINFLESEINEFIELSKYEYRFLKDDIN